MEEKIIKIKLQEFCEKPCKFDILRIEDVTGCNDNDNATFVVFNWQNVEDCNCGISFAIVYDDYTTFTTRDWQCPFEQDISFEDAINHDAGWMDSDFKDIIVFSGLPRYSPF